MGQAHNQRDYFAEMYVAGNFADAGWNVYFPRRDKGFDFVVTKEVTSRTIVRPVQVKGKYPELDKTDKGIYGYIGKLTALHPDMVLAIPYFPTLNTATAPTCVAYMPRFQIRPQQGRGWRCTPATFDRGLAIPRRDFQRYFDRPGLALMEQIGWESPEISPPAATAELGQFPSLSQGNGRTPAGSSRRASVAVQPPAKPNKKRRATSAPAKERVDGRPRDVTGFFAKRLGIQPERFPRLTNGDLRKAAEVDIATMHGWIYRGGELPEANLKKLDALFKSLVTFTEPQDD
jgi:hypothetical protein